MLNTILEIFNDAGNQKLAIPMKAYMKNKFEYFGIKTPERRSISKPILLESKSLTKRQTIHFAKQLWNQPQRELHYLAQELLCQNLKTDITKDDIVWMEWFVLHNSWWDTVDVIAPKLMSTYFKKFPDQRSVKIKEWISTGNIWLIRSAILFQLKYKTETDLPLLFETVLKTCHTKEFFINKAIGWVLRENSKRIPDVINTFIEEHKNVLSNLSIREGLKLSPERIPSAVKK